MECLGKKAQRAAIFQDELCIAILRGFKRQLLRDRRMRHGEVGLTQHEEGVMHDGDDEVAIAQRSGHGRLTTAQDNGHGRSEQDGHALIVGRPDRFMDDLTGLPPRPGTMQSSQEERDRLLQVEGRLGDQVNRRGNTENGPATN